MILCPNSQSSSSMFALTFESSSTRCSALSSTRTERQRNVHRALSSQTCARRRAAATSSVGSPWHPVFSERL